MQTTPRPDTDDATLARIAGEVAQQSTVAYVAVMNAGDISDGYSLEIEIEPFASISHTLDTGTRNYNAALSLAEALDRALVAAGVTVYTDRDEWEASTEEEED